MGLLKRYLVLSALLPTLFVAAYSYSDDAPKPSTPPSDEPELWADPLPDITKTTEQQPEATGTGTQTTPTPPSTEPNPAATAPVSTETAAPIQQGNQAEPTATSNPTEGTDVNSIVQDIKDAQTNLSIQKNNEEGHAELKKHISDFLSSIGVNKTAENPSPESNTPATAENSSETAPATASDAVVPPPLTMENDLPGGLDSNIANSGNQDNKEAASKSAGTTTTPTPQPASTPPSPPVKDPEDTAIDAIIARNTTLSKDQILKYAGTCVTLPDNLKNCTKYECSMPASPDSDIILQRSIEPSTDGSCILTDDIANVSTIKCSLDQSNLALLTDIIAKQFVNYGKADIDKTYSVMADNCSITAGKQGSSTLTKASSVLSDDMIAKISYTGIKSTKKNVKSTATKKEEELKDNKDVLSESDKAYFEMLDEKKKLLPENQRLSDTTSGTIDDLTKNFAKVKSKKSKQSDSYISVNHGNSVETGIIDQDGNVTSDNKDYNLSISANKGDDSYITDSENLNKAYNALIAGQTEAAINIYKSVTEKSPKNVNALFGLATAYHKNMQLNQAREIYIEILKIDPNHKEALNNFLVLISDESPDDALIELEKLERVNNDFSPISAQIAMIHLKEGRLEQAERYLKKAITLSPDNISYKYNLAIVSDKLGNAKQAAQFYQQVLDAAENGSVIPGSLEKIKERLTYLKKKSG